MNKLARRGAAALLSVVALVVLAFGAAPASAHENDISPSFTATPSKFASGKVNTADVALTFTLQTNPLEYMIIELPAGYRFNHGPATLAEYNFPAAAGNGNCDGTDTFVVGSVVDGGWLCQVDPAHPNQFKIQVDNGTVFPTTQMTVTLKAGAFTAGTATSDTPGFIEVRTYVVGVPDILDEHGRVAVTTVAPALPNTGTSSGITLSVLALASLLVASGVALRYARRSIQ
jgi:LPXTG-motif cell wall-anchored protein